jgi:hypothetical protein
VLLRERAVGAFGAGGHQLIEIHFFGAIGYLIFGRKHAALGLS